jgi:ElaB/YqjD/DUF883 family membrane-anchored ribosome-binding protein
MTNPSTVGNATHEFADKAAESADAAIRSARQKAHDALDGLTNTMQSVKDQANATLEKLRPQIDTVASYAKEEPTKALLIAAAAGAGIMGLVALMSRSSSGRGISAELLRNAAYDARDNARRSARDIAREATDRASGQGRRADEADPRRGANRLRRSDRHGAAVEGPGRPDGRQDGSPADRQRDELHQGRSGQGAAYRRCCGAALMGLMSTLTRS